MRTLALTATALAALAAIALVAGLPRALDRRDRALPPDAPPTAAAPLPSAAGSGQQAAWQNALNLAYQIAASQGFRQRATRWEDILPDEGFRIIPLTLLAGNQYFVILGSDAPAGSISVAAFDPDRMLIPAPPDEGDGRIVLKLTPQKSGEHYLRIHKRDDAAPPIHCALTYVYR